jgi:hypothetical protein
MTLGHTSPEPETCTCCSRPAIPLAALPVSGSTQGFFVCAFCSLTLAFKVISMKPNQLHDIEHGAIEKAVKQTIKPILESLLGCLWNHGVRELKAIEQDTFQQMCIAVSDDREFNNAMKATFLSYTQAIRLELTNLK